MRLTTFVSRSLAALLALSAIGAGQSRPAPAAPEVIVYKTATCGCCAKWVEHLRTHGFQAKSIDVSDLNEVKVKNRVPENLRTCHTALVDGYVIEGHVPADAVQKLLREKPQVAGIAVAGMPLGSPGMESSSPERYNVVTFDKTGAAKIYVQK